jgi:hypothetical protein
MSISISPVTFIILLRKDAVEVVVVVETSAALVSLAVVVTVLPRSFVVEVLAVPTVVVTEPDVPPQMQMPDTPPEILPEMPVEMVPEMPVEMLPEMPVGRLPEMKVEMPPEMPMEMLPETPVEMLPDTFLQVQLDPGAAPETETVERPRATLICLSTESGNLIVKVLMASA